MANEQQEQKRTASQRIDDLERGLMSMYQNSDAMARDMQVIKDAIKLLGNKLDALVKLSNQEVSEKINDDAIGQIMVNNNIADLKEKVTNLVSQGILVASEEVTDSSFVVGQELDDQGTVVNPRLQFALGALGEELKSKIKATKLGDTVTLQEGKLQFKLLESYTIQSPAQANTAPVEAEAQSSSNEDASAQSAPAEQITGS